MLSEWCSSANARALPGNNKAEVNCQSSLANWVTVEKGHVGEKTYERVHPKGDLLENGALDVALTYRRHWYS